MDTISFEDCTKCLKVGTCLFGTIFEFNGGYSIEIPDYQRPYVWNIDKVETLIGDLDDHIKKSGQHYYMGSILFYSKDNCYEIIDGQQRLTTLLIIDKIANNGQSILERKSDIAKFNFNSPISKKNIVAVRDYLKNDKLDWLKKNWNKVIRDLTFSVIVTKRQDDAFSFFETQNNRGVKLSAADYLKSYHLRELKNDEGKQEIFAKQWDFNNAKKPLNDLFTNIIWRGRLWRGKNVWQETQDDILNEFQKNTLSTTLKNHVYIYSNTHKKNTHLVRYENNEGLMYDHPPVLPQAKAIHYPFALRQPIEKGIGFFLYTERYTEIYHLLFEPTESTHTLNFELQRFMDFYAKVYIESRMSKYLNSLFRLCVVMYYDKFESEQLVKFAKHLDYYIGAYRIALSSVYEKSAMKILSESKQNLLDVISQAFIPEEIFNFILVNAKEEVFRVEDKEIPLNHENGQPINTVRSNYKRALLNYYNETNESSLKLLKEWIKK